MMERSVAGILLCDSMVFVAKRGPVGSFGGCWEFPGGKVENGESDEDAVIREFDEEFGITVYAKSLLGEVLFPHHGRDRVLAAWLIEVVPFRRPRLFEHEAVAWVCASDLEALCLVDSDRQALQFVLPLLLP
jgi:8-oxo-dGTP diphosphatase